MLSLRKSFQMIWADDLARKEMKRDFKRLFIANILAIVAIAILSQYLPRPLKTYINVIAIGFAMDLYELATIYKNAVYNYCARL